MSSVLHFKIPNFHIYLSLITYNYSISLGQKMKLELLTTCHCSLGCTKLLNSTSSCTAAFLLIVFTCISGEIIKLQM